MAGSAGQNRSAKDKQMASNLKTAGIDRQTGQCCICYKTISNGRGAEAHYAAHSRGAADSKAKG